MNAKENWFINRFATILSSVIADRRSRFVAALAILQILMLSSAIASVPFSIAPSAGSAFASQGGSLSVGDVPSSLKAMSDGFTVSESYLDLSPEVIEVPYGHKYEQTSRSVIVSVPNTAFYPVRFESSNTKVATAKWEGTKASQAKLTVYGVGHGEATITISNNYSYETLEIKVVVNGYDSEDFSASKTRLDLSPKQKKIAGGCKYTSRSKTITVAVPDGASVYFKSSNLSIAEPAWIKKWNGNTTKLKIVGHRSGTATVTLTNSKTKEKIKIKVTVGGFDLGVRLRESTIRHSKGNSEYYRINSIKLINKTGSVARIDKKCSLRIWTTDTKTGKLVAEDEPEDFAGAVAIGKGKSKTVFFGEKYETNKKGEYYYSEDEKWDRTYWKKIAFTVKVGKKYKTIYVDSWGMVTKVHNGLDFKKGSFKVSQRDVFLEVKQQKTENGTKYVPASKTISVTVPDGDSAYFEESNSDVVSAEWISRVGNTLKLRITAHKPVTDIYETISLTCDSSSKEKEILVFADAVT